MQTMTTPAAEPNVPGGPSFRLTIAVNLPATLREDPCTNPETPTVSRDDIDEEFMSDLNASVSRFLRTASEDDLLDLSGALGDWEWRLEEDKPIPFASSAIAAKFLDGSEESRRAEAILFAGLDRLRGICDAICAEGGEIIAEALHPFARPGEQEDQDGE